MLKRGLLSAAIAVSAGAAQAQEIKVGVMLPFTGVGAEFGQQGERGIEQYHEAQRRQAEALQVQDHQA